MWGLWSCRRQEQQCSYTATEYCGSISCAEHASFTVSVRSAPNKFTNTTTSDDAAESVEASYSGFNTDANTIIASLGSCTASIGCAKCSNACAEQAPVGSCSANIRSVELFNACAEQSSLGSCCASIACAKCFNDCAERGFNAQFKRSFVFSVPSSRLGANVGPQRFTIDYPGTRPRRSTSIRLAASCSALRHWVDCRCVPGVESCGIVLLSYAASYS